MDRKPVDSSNLSSVGYDPASKTLEIEFNSGSIYQYSGVPEYIYNGLMNAPSKGKYLNQNVKTRYDYIKLS